MNHPTMFDIETLGTAPGSVVVSIGAVKFDWEKASVVSSFIVNIDPKDAMKYGLKIDPATVEWWSKQSKEARMSWRQDPQPLKEALEQFSEWYGSKGQIWCNGASFDYPILSGAYRAVGMKAPWSYWDEHDMRTIINISGARPAWKKLCEADTSFHDAMGDSIRQAVFLAELMGKTND